MIDRDDTDRDDTDRNDTDAPPGFNHNDFYHRDLLRHVPPGCDRALDIGCGTGVFARRLARHARSVDALDRSPEVIAKARELSTATPNVDYLEADLADHDLGSERYDYIACLASIHHMPFAPTIEKLREALTPGGVLAILGCYHQATLVDYLPDLVAIPANLAANAAIKWKARRHPSRITARRNTAPVMDPRMTLPEIRHEAQRLLPGAVIRQRVFWRYTLFYRRPSTTA